ncbi:MAG: GNAT family N-acetyltransferase [Defluviitaleaceae bacterium]|nr:GNAT family N-acetyltransferase [Defluviitaleaceae bacterium]
MFFTDLETNRLHLQCISQAHRYFFYVLYTNDEVLRFHSEEDRYADIYGADTEIAEWNQPEPRNQHGWVFVCKTDGVAMGTCVFDNWDKNTAFCEVHYDMHPDFWGKGYMTEAVRAIIEFARDEMKVRCIETGMDEENVSSIKLAERLGFEYIGQTVEAERIYRLCF